MAEAREMLERYMAAFPHPSMDVSKIRETLDSAVSASDRGSRAARLGPDARRQFSQLALSLATAQR
jgi:hypothetical protein